MIEAQNQREALAAGQITPQDIGYTTASYGARLWNSSVTIQGVTGNPFVPFFGGAPPPLDLSINLNPGAIASVTTAAQGRNVNIWIANSQTFVTNTVWVRIVPVPLYNPWDYDLARTLLTFEVSFNGSGGTLKPTIFFSHTGVAGANNWSGSATYTLHVWARRNSDLLTWLVRNGPSNSRGRLGRRGRPHPCRDISISKKVFQPLPACSDSRNYTSDDFVMSKDEPASFL